MMKKPFGEKMFGPKLRLDTDIKIPDMRNAHTTPAVGGKAAVPAKVTAPVAATATKKMSSRALKRAAATKQSKSTATK